MSFEVIQSPIDRDRKLKIMEELIKTNQKHIEHLKQTIIQLKKQLVFEQTRNRDMDKENVTLRQHIKLLTDRKLLLNASTQTQLKREVRHNSFKEPNSHSDQKKNIMDPPNFSRMALQTEEQQQYQQVKKVPKPGLKLDVHSALTRQQTLGPLTSVKRSMKYLSGLTDEKLIDAIKERIPVKMEKNGRQSLTQSQSTQRQRSLLFNFSQSTVFDNKTDVNISDFGKQFFETIQEEQHYGNETSALKSQNVKLFEKFYIMGCSKQEFSEFDNDQSIKEGILPASILYKSDPNIEEAYESIIHGFVYPFGNQVEKIKVNDSFRKLKEIMYSGNKYELLDKFHIFTIKNQDEEFLEKDYNNSILLNASNPERLLFGICLSVYDYIETTPDDIALTYKNRKKRIFWRYKKTYCFLTYFPFFELFQDLLIAIINLIKISRTSRYVEKNTEEYEVLKELDGQQIIQQLKPQIVEFLKNIGKVTPLQSHQQLEFNTEAGLLKYKIPNQLLISSEIRLWSANLTLQILDPRDLITIYLAILHETTVVFISDKLSILTSIIHFFHNIIRPISWTNPIIYSVPEQLMTMVESPVPIIIGINLSEADFNIFDIKERVEQCVFVFLDREKENKVSPKPFQLLNEFKTPHMRGLIAQIEHQMRSQSIVRNPSPGMRPVKSNDKKNIRFAFDENDLKKSRIILDLFMKIMTENVTNKLPPKNQNGLIVDDLVNLKLLEELMVQKTEQCDKDFMRMLFNTQYFQYFLQEYYLQ